MVDYSTLYEKGECLDCGTKISVSTGRFVCKLCLETMFGRFRKNQKGEIEVKKTNKEQVAELTEKGWKPKEIVEETGIKPHTVYAIRTQIKKESEKKPIATGTVKEPKTVDLSEEEIVYYKNQIKLLEAELKNKDDLHRDIIKSYHKLEKEKLELEAENEKESDTISESCSTDSSEIKGLTHTIDLLEKKIENIRNYHVEENERIKRHAVEQIEKLRKERNAERQSHEKEKDSHEKLLDYLFASKKAI